MSNSQRFWRGFFLLFFVAALCAGLALPAVEDSPARAAPQAQAPVPHIVISQVYGGGGTSGATFDHDYVELFNPSNGPLLLDNLSIQYASATQGAELFSDNPIVVLSGGIAAGQFYLVELGSSGSAGSALPTPDASGTINMDGPNGKVILARGTNPLPCNGTIPCDPPAEIVDLVGYGSSNYFEGSGPAPRISRTTSAQRKSRGCIDTDNNRADFVASAPIPHNSNFPILSCTDKWLGQTATAAARTSTAAAQSLIISEFRTSGPQLGNDEFIELYNPTGSSISIQNWMVRKESCSGAANNPPIGPLPAVTLAPGQHYLITGSKYSGSVKTDWTADIGVADNGGIALFRNDGAIVDQVGFCTTTYHEGTPLLPTTSNTNRSYDRNRGTSGICVDNNNNRSDFFVRLPSDPQNSTVITPSACGNPTRTFTPTRTPTRTRTPSRTPTKFRTRTPTPAPPPKLLGINEFVPRPGHDWNHDGLINTGDEYIELINFGVVDVPLSGYSLDDEVNIGSSPYRLPAVTMKPGERRVFFGSETGLHLDDGGDGVRLLKPNGQLADAYNYSVVRFPDESFCRLPDNGGLDDWNQFCSPTPGLQNSAGESSLGPPTSGNDEALCPIADTLPGDFVFAECQPFGHNIWNPDYWDRHGWFDEKGLPGSPSKWPLFGD